MFKWASSAFILVRFSVSPKILIFLVSGLCSSMSHAGPTALPVDYNYSSVEAINVRNIQSMGYHAVIKRNEVKVFKFKDGTYARFIRINIVGSIQYEQVGSSWKEGEPDPASTYWLENVIIYGYVYYPNDADKRNQWITNVWYAVYYGSNLYAMPWYDPYWYQTTYW